MSDVPVSVYQLRVEGPDKNGTTLRQKFYSKKVFLSAKECEDYLAEFSAMCCGRGFYDLEEVTGHLVLELNVQPKKEVSDGG